MTSDIDILIEDPRWTEAGFEDVCTASVRAVLSHLAITTPVELSVLACDDARISELNAEFRGKPTPTNVLSWPDEERGAEVAGDDPEPAEPDPTGQIVLGDIAIAYDTCLAEADAAGRSLADHATHLTVHGVLHLLGYDHERDADATLMEGIEIQILGKMGIEDPYRVLS